MCQMQRPSGHLFTPPGDPTRQDSWFVLEKCGARQGGCRGAGLGEGITYVPVEDWRDGGGAGMVAQSLRGISMEVVVGGGSSEKHYGAQKERQQG